MTEVSERYAAPALEKGLDILELLAAEPEGVSKSEIARRLDRTISEIFRMLAVLERRGFIIAQNGTDKYTLTLKLFALSHRFPPVRRLGIVSAEVMRRLAFETQQSCHMTVYYSGQAHVVAQQDAPADVIFSVRLGVEVPLVNSCSGHVLLAFADGDLREAMLKEMPPTRTRPSPTELADMVARVRHQGYEQMNSPRTLGSTDIGVPVFDHRGSIIASLVVPFLGRLDQTTRVGVDDVIAALIAASHEISAGLGFSPED